VDDVPPDTAKGTIMTTTAPRQFPGHTFRLTTPVDAHHDRARWGRDLVGPSGEPVVVGVDFAELAEDGRIREVTGFFEPA
jgi:ketosteroid isomerase-like protein